MDTIQIETGNVVIECGEVLEMIKDSRKDNPNDNLFVDRMQVFSDRFDEIDCPAFDDVTDENVAGNIDVTSAILIQNTFTENHIPISSTPNTASFFNALSTALYGREEFSNVLRIKTFFYMAKNWLSMLEWYGRFTAYIDCPYEEFINCGLYGGPSSVLTFVAAARALQITIESCYPIVNGITSTPFRDLNTTFTPNGDCQSRKDVVILWTGPPKIRGEIWQPDHFVCMVPVNHNKSMEHFVSPENVQLTTTVFEDTPSGGTDDSSCLVIAIPSTSRAVEPSRENSTILESSIDSTVMGSLKELTTDIVANEPVRLVEPYVDPSKGTYPLTSCLSNSDAYSFIKNCKHIHEQVPIFPKKDVQFVVNYKNYFLNNAYRFYDECGSWNRASRKRNEFCYLLPHLNLINRRRDVFCKRKIVNRAVSFVPIVPQPDPKTIVKITKLYQEHSRDPSFSRTIFLLNEHDAAHALYQYKGQQPHDEHMTKRLNPMVYHSIRKTIAANQHLGKDAMNSIKSVTGVCGKSLRNLKHYEKKRLKRKAAQTEAASDTRVKAPQLCNKTVQVVVNMKDATAPPTSQNCLDLVGEGFVQAIKSVSSNSFTLVMFTDEQLSDMLECGERFRSPLGIARAFELGEYLITAVSYQNLKVVKRGTSETPTFIGPVLVQPKGEVADYGFFVSTLKEVITNRKPNIEFTKLIFVSDCELELTRALHEHFPKSTKTRCLMDVKNSVEKDLADQSILSAKDQASVLKQIVCLLFAKNRSSFTAIKKSLLSSKCVKGVKKYLEDVMTLIRQVCFPVWEKNLPAPLSLTQSEGMAQAIDGYEGWGVETMVELVTNMEMIVRTQCNDLYKSMWHGEGPYKLKQRNRTPQVTVEQQRDGVWSGCRDNV